MVLVEKDAVLVVDGDLACTREAAQAGPFLVYDHAWFLLSLLLHFPLLFVDLLLNQCLFLQSLELFFQILILLQLLLLLCLDIILNNYSLLFLGDQVLIQAVSVVFYRTCVSCNSRSHVVLVFNLFLGLED